MTKRRYAFAILIALALIANIPNMSLAAENTQSSQMPAAQNYAAGQQDQTASQPSTPPASVNQSQSGGGSGQVPQPKGGVATVIGVDQPENCLRIRSGPGNYYDVIGCANMGDQLNITGVWTSNDWAQLADNSWVYGSQIQTDLRPPRTAYSRSPSYVVTEEVTPDYGDWAYLPDYGYDTYWYGGLPIFFYNVGVWNRFHPWWWHRGHQAWWWQGGHHGKRAWNSHQFNNFVRSGTNRNFATNRANISSFNRAGRGAINNRSNISSSNLNRFNRNQFNTNRFRSGSTNAFRSRTFSSPKTFRSGSANAFRSRSFSTPHTFRSGSVNTFRSQSFSTPHAFRGGSFGGRQFSGIAPSGGSSMPHFSGGAHFGGGGGVHFGGGHFGGGGGGRHR
jgi:hypothetical protein